jgi:hypothetical protein
LLDLLLLMRSNRALSVLHRAPAVRLCALSLVVLATLPFTAPFAALNWSDFLSSGRTRQVVATIGIPVASNAQDDADDAAASDACVQRVHSLRSCELAPVASPVAGHPLTSTLAELSHLWPPPSARGAYALVTILRV